MPDDEAISQIVFGQPGSKTDSLVLPMTMADYKSATWRLN
jgi:autotransporter translocation and assembly factor TamB